MANRITIVHQCIGRSTKPNRMKDSIAGSILCIHSQSLLCRQILCIHIQYIYSTHTLVRYWLSVFCLLFFLFFCIYMYKNLHYSFKKPHYPRSCWINAYIHNETSLSSRWKDSIFLSDADAAVVIVVAHR